MLRKISPQQGVALRPSGANAFGAGPFGRILVVEEAASGLPFVCVTLGRGLDADLAKAETEPVGENAGRSERGDAETDSRRRREYGEGAGSRSRPSKRLFDETVGEIGKRKAGHDDADDFQPFDIAKQCVARKDDNRPVEKIERVGKHPDQTIGRELSKRVAMVVWLVPQ